MNCKKLISGQNIRDLFDKIIISKDELQTSVSSLRVNFTKVVISFQDIEEAAADPADFNLIQEKLLDFSDALFAGSIEIADIRNMIINLRLYLRQLTNELASSCSKCKSDLNEKINKIQTTLQELLNGYESASTIVVQVSNSIVKLNLDAVNDDQDAVNQDIIDLSQLVIEAQKLLPVLDKLFLSYREQLLVILNLVVECNLLQNYTCCNNKQTL